ncbi:hypothetical protein K438DRAFT_531195 [Mycena galopus ATCC 62051]|nr:hypothetical protein K438DRAFT_531195 [Mycena galopus ATCC 62051]
MHPNVLRIEGVSSPASLAQFITYENAHGKTADGPLAAALKDDLTRSITLGFKMIVALSSGMNHLSVQGISMSALGVENFDVFLDVNDRFLIGINPRMSTEVDASNEDPEDNATTSWNVFNALCQKVLRSANRVLHNEDIERDPVIIDSAPRPSMPQKSAPYAVSSQFFYSPRSQDHSEHEPSFPPRREYVWRSVDRGQQSLATVASRIARDLDMKLSLEVNKLAWTDGRSAHRCPGYVREEITLTITTNDSAIISHDAPSPLEICSVCHEVVGVHEQFRCICGEANPGLRPTVKCQKCQIWSHSDCVRNSKEFICEFCICDSDIFLGGASYPPLRFDTAQLEPPTGRTEHGPPQQIEFVSRASHTQHDRTSIATPDPSRSTLPIPAWTNSASYPLPPPPIIPPPLYKKSASPMIPDTPTYSYSNITSPASSISPPTPTGPVDLTARIHEWKGHYEVPDGTLLPMISRRRPNNVGNGSYDMSNLTGAFAFEADPQSSNFSRPASTPFEQSHYSPSNSAGTNMLWETSTSNANPWSEFAHYPSAHRGLEPTYENHSASERLSVHFGIPSSAERDGWANHFSGPTPSYPSPTTSNWDNHYYNTHQASTPGGPERRSFSDGTRRAYPISRQPIPLVRRTARVEPHSAVEGKFDLLPFGPVKLCIIKPHKIT